MNNPVAKPSMKRFEPDSGWSEAGGPVIAINEYIKKDDKPEESGQSLSAEDLINLGESMQDVFNNLIITDPCLQAWTQVHAAIRLLGSKLEEKHALEAKLASSKIEIEEIRALASELVVNAHRSEIEAHATSKLRVQIAESLNEKLIKALKN